MRHVSAHGKLLALSSGVLVLTLSAVVLTGCGMANSRNHEKVAEAYDRVVPSMTRADDLAGLGLDTRDATLVAPVLLNIKGEAAQACVAAGNQCSGYVYHTLGGDIALLVMDGRVIDKVFIAKA